MPIVYSTEKQGWILDNPTPEEIEQIQELGTQEFMHRFSAMVMDRAIKASQEDEAYEGGIPDGVVVN